MEKQDEKVEVTSTSQLKNDTEEWEEASENESEPVKTNKPINNSKGAKNLRSWLNLPLRIEMTDKRVLVGMFLCTDRDANVILGSCSEYLPEDETTPKEEPRMLGLIMVPGKHIVSICIDQVEKNLSLITKTTQEVV